MSVQLTRLYNEMHTDYNVRLLTDSCFDKKIDWVHMVEKTEFIELLHGGELVFNSGLNDETEEHRKSYIQKLIQVQAGGLIVALQENHDFSKEIIEYCNQNELPLFQAAWDTSYLIIMRRFSETLLDNERQEMNLIAALKNAIYHPMDESQYTYRFEQNGFPVNGGYVISILSSTNPEHDYKINRMRMLERIIHQFAPQNIMYEERGKLILLTVGLSPFAIKSQLTELCKKQPTISAKIGSLEINLNSIYKSHQNARITYNIGETAVKENILCYDDIGAYQLLSNVNDPDVLYPAFVNQTLGKLIEYDALHRTDYMDVLKLYFENNCSITQTANESFYHQNTLKYKIKAIKEILGYDITTNNHRLNILLALAIMRLEGEVASE